MHDPVRFQLSGPPEVQVLLRAAHGDGPTPAQLDHLAGKLGPAIAAAPAVGLAGVKLWIVAGLAVVGFGGAVWLAREPQRPTTASASSTPVSVPASAPVAAPAPAPAPEPAPAIAVTPSPPPAPPPAAAPAASPPRSRGERPIAARLVEPPAPARASPPPTEIELLGPAHTALRAGELARALELAARHEAMYSKGALAEEREAIAIEAEARLGHGERARVRFDALVARFPRSGYRARLERLVAEP